MSALPKAVQKQIAAANAVADKYYKSLAAGEAPVPPAGDSPVPPVEGEAADIRVKPVEPNPIPDPTPPPPSGAAEPVAKLPVEEWEQKYRVLQGKYNAEVPRLQKQGSDQAEAIRRLQEQLTATQTLLASLGDRQAAAAPAGSARPTNAPAAPVSLIKDDEIKEFGADLIDVTRRVAREEISGAIEAEVARRMQPIEQRATQAANTAKGVARRVAQQDEQTVIDLLAREVPNFRDLNRDQEFVAWLDQKDPFSGLVRGQMLEQAYQSHDGPRVVTFFKGYLTEHAAVTPTPAPAAAAPNKAPAPQRTLEQLVTPGTPKTGAAGTQDGSGKRVWTGAEISKFYADRAAGRYNSEAGKAKATAMEADIFAAQREGRVR